MAHSVLEKKHCGLNSTIDLWREIPGWEGFYEASRLGGIRSMTRKIESSRGYEIVREAQIIRLFKNPAGYYQVDLHRNGKKYSRKVHQLVLEAFVGLRPSKESCCCHANDIRTDNRIENLSWGTPQSNALEMAQRDRIKGERHSRAKLTAFQAFMIQESPARNAALARQLGLAPYLIRNARKHSWQWL